MFLSVWKSKYQCLFINISEICFLIQKYCLKKKKSWTPELMIENCVSEINSNTGIENSLSIASWLTAAAAKSKQ